MPQDAGVLAAAFDGGEVVIRSGVCFRVGPQPLLGRIGENGGELRAGEILAFQRLHRVRADEPAALPRDAHRDRFVFLRVQRAHHRAGRHNAHLVFAGAPAE